MLFTLAQDPPNDPSNVLGIAAVVAFCFLVVGLSIMVARSHRARTNRELGRRRDQDDVKLDRQ